MFRLNAVAPLNIAPMSVTCDVFQPPMFRLNAVAFMNMPVILVTRDVSQFQGWPMSTAW